MFNKIKNTPLSGINGYDVVREIQTEDNRILKPLVYDGKLYIPMILHKRYDVIPFYYEIDGELIKELVKGENG